MEPSGDERGQSLRLPARRREVILERLARDGCVRVLELARDFGVTDETVRRDLEALAREKLLVRTHGGAVVRSDGHVDLPLPERAPFHRADKLRIGRLAATLLTSRSTVFLDASSTVLAMAGQLADQDAAVITNANHVVAALADRQNLQVVCTGGDYERRSRSYVGPLAEQAVQHYHVQWLFMGVDGIDGAWGASEINQGQARLKERLCVMADRVCVLTDPSKLGVKSAFLISPLQHIDVLITTREAPEPALAPFREAGVEIRLAE